MSNTTLPYGRWPSPITPQYLSQGKRLTEVGWDSDGHTLVWLEEESSQGILHCMNINNPIPRKLTNTLSIKAKVGYGGGEFTVGHGHVYFAEASGQLFRQSLINGEPKPLLPPLGCAASPCLSPDGKYLIYVHSHQNTDLLMIIDSKGHLQPQKFTAGADFYMQPTWHPSGEKLSWIEWNHPQMPWEGTYLVIATLSKAQEENLPRPLTTQVITGQIDVAIFQPTFSPDGSLLAYISDQNGWSNLWVYDLKKKVHRCLFEIPSEFGVPAWTQGRRTYGFSHDGQHIYFVRNERGRWYSGILEVSTGKTNTLEALTKYTSLMQIAISPTKPAIAVIASSGTTPQQIITYVNQTGVHVHAQATDKNIQTKQLSQPEPIEWKTPTGEKLHGIYYPPTNPHYKGKGHPPAIIQIHGGPTSQRDCSFNPSSQFFATRGYAVLEVNYRGSTGYGKAYRNSLNGKWGIYDVEDAISGAQHLFDNGLANRERIAIMGGSAGGYTVLQALTNHPGFFKAGVCLYGISNLFTLNAETHKFESHYLKSLLGPLPEYNRTYHERSPIFKAHTIRDALVIFQGDEDKVVPKNQAECMITALEKHSVPYEYYLYSGEGHGWKKKETVKKFYVSVEAFLKRHLLS